MERLRRDMNRLFETNLPRGQRQRTATFPAINVYTNKDEGILVTAELPGIHTEELNISVTGDTLTLSGSRQSEEMPESAQYHRRERGFGEFNRTVQLPFAINKEKVEATVQSGVLQVTLPRAEAEKPRQISIKAGK
jgi:HSP20 family protein